MRNILIFVLLLCLCLSLYSYIFLDGQAINFEEAYKNALDYILDIGSVIDGVRDGIKETIKVIVDIPGYIKQSINRVGLFFTGLWNRIVIFFGGETSCVCADPSSCIDCNCNASDCICGDVFSSNCEHPDFVGPCKDCGCSCERCEP